MQPVQFKKNKKIQRPFGSGRSHWKPPPPDIWGVSIILFFAIEGISEEKSGSPSSYDDQSPWDFEAGGSCSCVECTICSVYMDISCVKITHFRHKRLLLLKPLRLTCGFFKLINLIL